MYFFVSSAHALSEEEKRRVFINGILLFAQIFVLLLEKLQGFFSDKCRAGL